MFAGEIKPTVYNPNVAQVEQLIQNVCVLFIYIYISKIEFC